MDFFNERNSQKSGYGRGDDHAPKFQKILLCNNFLGWLLNMGISKNLELPSENLCQNFTLKKFWRIIYQEKIWVKILKIETCWNHHNTLMIGGSLIWKSLFLSYGIRLGRKEKFGNFEDFILRQGEKRKFKKGFEKKTQEPRLVSSIATHHRSSCSRNKF